MADEGGGGGGARSILALFSRAGDLQRRIEALPPWLHPRRSVPSLALLVIALLLVLPFLRGGDDGREVRLPGYEREGRFQSAFDRVRAAAEGAARAAVGERPGQWGRTTFHGEFGTGYQINLDATFSEPGTGDPIRLAVVCTDETGALDVYISWSATRYLAKDGGGGAGWKLVTLQSQGAQSTERWILTGDRRSTFAPEPARLLEGIRSSREVRAKLADSDWALFDTSGLDEALSTLREGCGLEI